VLTENVTLEAPVFRFTTGGGGVTVTCTTDPTGETLICIPH